MSLQPKTGVVAPALLAWWAANGRKDLAWQQNPTRYRVWVSEVMLQQTQVATVERYYDRFMKQFPTVTDLAAADQDRVLHLWSGLGYYARARNLHKAARLIMGLHAGELPDDIAVLQSLPGIGRSTAGAILALADDRRHPILDGNAKRVYARVFGVEGWPGQGAVLKELWDVADACTPASGAAVYTQAIMDLGATVCRRQNPDCDRCPLSDLCLARKHGLIDSIPGKRPQRVGRSVSSRSARSLSLWPYVKMAPFYCKSDPTRESGVGYGVSPRPMGSNGLANGVMPPSVICRRKPGFGPSCATALRISIST